MSSTAFTLYTVFVTAQTTITRCSALTDDLQIMVSVMKLDIKFFFVVGKTTAVAGKHHE